jgi:hypothetical protein
MPGQCKCPGDPNGVTKSLHYERQCNRFIQITEAQREAKREEWKRIMNPPVRAKKETEDES